jgi:CubicO group peptidase (beta-lactamase class C family)
MSLFRINASLLILLCLISPSSASTAPDTDLRPLVNKLNLILSNQSHDKAGMSFLLRKDDAVIMKFSKGLANKDKHLAIDTNTGFRIGSISKPFTALAIMKLAEQDKLSLDDPVTQFIPQLPSKWRNVTLKHLLSHRVYLSQDFFSSSNLHLADNSTNQDLVEFVSSDTMNVKALAVNKAIYCNACFVLLAEVIANASGTGFAAYLNQAIFVPAGMNNTYIVEEGVPIKLGDALNYANTESFFGIHQYTTGAMAQVSSVEDLNNFIIALKKGRIISKGSLNLMTKVHSEAGVDGTFGLGWMLGWGDEPFYSHGGSQDGYQAELFIHPRHNLEIIILSNGGDKTYSLQAQIMRTVMTHYKGI